MHVIIISLSLSASLLSLVVTTLSMYACVYSFMHLIIDITTILIIVGAVPFLLLSYSRAAHVEHE